MPDAMRVAVGGPFWLLANIKLGAPTTSNMNGSQRY
jgi:hypothetical protein